MQKLFFLKKNEYISFIKDIESPMYNQRASHNISKLKEYIPDKCGLFGIKIFYLFKSCMEIARYIFLCYCFRYMKKLIRYRDQYITFSHAKITSVTDYSCSRDRIRIISWEIMEDTKKTTKNPNVHLYVILDILYASMYIMAGYNEKAI